MNDQLAMYSLVQLMEMPGFKMDNSVIEADGIQYHHAHLIRCEALFRAYIHVAAIREAKEIVSRAKVVLSE